MEVRVGAVSIDICTTSSSQASVRRHDKLAVNKRDEHTKIPFDSLIRKFLRYYIFKVALDKREAEYENCVDSVC